MAALLEIEMTNDDRPISKLELRNIIEKELARTIEFHRSSRKSQNEQYERPIGPPADKEIDEFIMTNPLTLLHAGYCFDAGRRNRLPGHSTRSPRGRHRRMGRDNRS